jgi:hypothetical protein
MGKNLEGSGRGVIERPNMIRSLIIRLFVGRNITNIVKVTFPIEWDDG